MTDGAPSTADLALMDRKLAIGVVETITPCEAAVGTGYVTYCPLEEG